jgi:hypothetical protein
MVTLTLADSEDNVKLGGVWQHGLKIVE